ncbi:hypothetical protein [Pseudonocardia sp. HH130629-09]|uniref:hypothetical protein n=1 Tax=Pseudonocardia sp. HH130629-09 TaxID=1641402 RepID=UPI0006CAF8EF|nr:hypothetical protein [Pseudonocardia sp. HH130629-09]ALE83075.1 hypothetical protein XF36_07835 [Pseudonocardia sp. HH130629-09]
MTVPNLPKVTTPDVSVSRLRVGRYGPRTLLRVVLVGLALMLLVLLLAGCGNGELPAAWRTPSPAPTTTSPTATPTPTPTTPSRTAEPSRTTAAPAPAPAPGRGGADGGGSGRTGAPGAAAAASPMWPAGDAATARRMQQQSDAGGDPWLLDPEEVTLSFVGSELGYRNPTVTRLGNGVYAATDGRTPQRATIRLTQPVRSGTGGIWVVDHVDRG